VWVCHPVSLNFYGSSNKKYENKSRKIKEKCCFYNFFLVVLFKKLWKQQIEQWIFNNCRLLFFIFCWVQWKDMADYWSSQISNYGPEFFFFFLGIIHFVSQFSYQFICYYYFLRLYWSGFIGISVKSWEVNKELHYCFPMWSNHLLLSFLVMEWLCKIACPYYSFCNKIHVLFEMYKFIFH